MSTDIMAIRGLLPGSEPSLFRPEDAKKLYSFPTGDDYAAAKAEASALLQRLADKHGDDLDAAQEEFADALEADKRLLSAVVLEAMDELSDDSATKEALAEKILRAGWIDSLRYWRRQ